jgi:hypothetical protein
VLCLVRDLIALRHERAADLATGAYATLPAPRGAWAFKRGEGVLVALNLSDGAVDVEGMRGTVAVSTSRERDGEALEGTVALGPWEGIVVT